MALKDKPRYEFELGQDDRAVIWTKTEDGRKLAWEIRATEYGVLRTSVIEEITGTRGVTQNEYGRGRKTGE